MDNYIWIALVILLSLFAGLVRVWKGPTAADRILAAQLFGTGGVAIILILVHAMQMPFLVDVALVYALLAAITMVVFVKWQRKEHERNREGNDESS